MIKIASSAKSLLAIRLASYDARLALAFFKGGQLASDCAFATGGVVLVDDAFFSGFVQCAGCDPIGCARLFNISALDRQVCFFHVATSAAAELQVLYTAFFILPIALDGGLDIGQKFLQNR